MIMAKWPACSQAAPNNVSNSTSPQTVQKANKGAPASKPSFSRLSVRSANLGVFLRATASRKNTWLNAPDTSKVGAISTVRVKP
ncbi:hypothetical protein D3C72_1801210 [compost metagenome]